MVRLWGQSCVGSRDLDITLSDLPSCNHPTYPSQGTESCGDLWIDFSGKLQLKVMLMIKKNGSTTEYRVEQLQNILPNFFGIMMCQYGLQCCTEQQGKIEMKWNRMATLEAVSPYGGSVAPKQEGSTFQQE